MNSERLYQAIEEAAMHDKAVILPDDIDVLLPCTMMGHGTFRVEGLYWIDEQRNIYQARLGHRPRSIAGGGLFISEIYVDGNCAPDGFSSDRTDMFCPENRYYTQI